jgi:hypothetical protein
MSVNGRRQIHPCPQIVVDIVVYFTTGEKSLLLINIDVLSRETQHLNTVHSFIYFSTICFARSIRRPSSVRNTTTHSERFVMAEYSLSLFLFLWRCGPTRASASSFFRFLDRRRRATVGKTPLDEWSVRCRDPYLTTHNTHNRQKSILPGRFEPAVSTGERPQNYALYRAATFFTISVVKYISWLQVPINEQ